MGPQKNISIIAALRYRVSSDEPGVYESNKQQVRENEIDMLTMRDTEANEWDGVHITGYDTMLPLRNSISPPRETSIPSIKSTLMPSKPL